MAYYLNNTLGVLEVGLILQEITISGIFPGNQKYHQFLQFS